MTQQKSASFDLEYEVHGSGEPVLFVSGLNDDRHSWDPTVETLIGFRSIVFDNRDVGASPQATGPYTIADMARDAIRVLDRAGVASAHVVGHSMGGLNAQEMALIAPDRVRSLVLEGTFPKPDEYLLTLLDLWDSWAELPDPREFVTAASYFWFGSSIMEELGVKGLVDMIVDAVAAQPVEAFQRQSAACRKVDTLDRLADITCPTLVVTAAEDRCVLEKHGRLLNEGIRSSRLIRIEKAGHSPHLERPELYNPILVEFLEGLATNEAAA